MILTDEQKRFLFLFGGCGRKRAIQCARTIAPITHDPVIEAELLQLADYLSRRKSQNWYQRLYQKTNEEMSWLLQELQNPCAEVLG